MEVTAAIHRRHQRRKANVKLAYSILQKELAKKQPDLGRAAVEVRRAGVPSGDMWRALDACAYVLDLYDADLNSYIHYTLNTTPD